MRSRWSTAVQVTTMVALLCLLLWRGDRWWVLAGCLLGLAAVLFWSFREVAAEEAAAAALPPGLPVSGADPPGIGQPLPVREPHTVLTGHAAAVTALVFSPAGGLLVTGARDGTAILWEIADPARPVPVASVAVPAARRRWRRRAGPEVGLGLRGRLLAVGGETVGMWDLTDPAQPAPIAILPEPGRSRMAGHAVCFSPDGRLLAVGSMDIVVLWDVTDPARPAPAGRLRTHRRLSLTPVNAVTFSPDGRLLVVDGGPDLVVFDVTEPARAAQVARCRMFPKSASTMAAATSLAFGPAGRLLAVAGYSQNSTPYGSSQQSAVLLWDLTDPARPARTASLVDRTGYRGRTRSRQRTARADPTTLTGHRGTVRAVAFGPDGRSMVSGGADGTALFWEVTDPAHPRPTATFARPGAVPAVAISPDGQFLATGGADATAALWSI
ncbi:WD40 repeat domain-containing protein [Actinoplanes sp. NPDC049599]|uniref:WD40 repeat domain-containing protein n=1 Tax=Actinoplanes sp. NPDC049599 TaxID=3363903 RepID=UPI0037B4076F